ncbi:MAG TPA: choice-of-anchor D domain-containing protein [Terriglobia bacterium]
MMEASGKVRFVAVAVTLLVLGSCLPATGQTSSGAVSLSTTSLVFTGVPLGTPSAPQTITLTNPGPGVLNISTIAVSNLFFSETSTCGTAVAAFGQCAISVTFEPVVANQQTGSLILTDSAANSPQLVSLAGTGSGPTAVLSATALTFSTLMVSAISPPQVVSLTNTGSQPLTIASFAVSGPFEQSNTCTTFEVAPGAFCTLSVTFSPTLPGLSTGQIEITDNASPFPQVIALSGVGSSFSLSVLPGSNSVSAGQSATYGVTVSGVYGFSQVVSLGCSLLPLGASCSFSPATVTPGATTPATSTLTVTTTGASAAPSGRAPAPPGPGTQRLFWLLLGGLPSLLPFRRRGRGPIRAGILVAGLLMAGLVMPGCGGTKTQPSLLTAAGTYTVQIDGTARVGSVSLHNQAPFTLVVQ